MGQRRNSNIKRYGSGHWYFSLKDATPRYAASCFVRKISILGWHPQDGMQVEVRALVTLYQARGDFQLKRRDYPRVGLGTLFEAFEQLRARLGKEGLFDPGRKKILPPFQNRSVSSPPRMGLRCMTCYLRYAAHAFPACNRLSRCGTGCRCFGKNGGMPFNRRQPGRMRCAET